MENFAEDVSMIFGTFVYQKLYGSDSLYILSEAVKLMREYEEELSFFRETSAISGINALAGEGYAQVSGETFGLIRAAKEYGSRTKGLLDITVAPLVKKWAFNRPEARVPQDEEIRSVLPLVGYDTIDLDPDSTGIKLPAKGQMIDLGAIAKGYIADQVVEYYRFKGLASALLNIGGNVKALGAKPDGEPWAIGIAQPEKHSTETAAILHVSNASVVTSGKYERGFLHDGKLYHHILDPRTGRPAESDLKSVTVVSPSSMEADAFSTPLFILGAEEGACFAKANGLEAVFITERDEIWITPGLQDRITVTSSMEPHIL